MKLHELRPAPGAIRKRKRVARGIAAGQGKTAGRGTKGQNARSGGGVRPYFEGGQLPLVRRLPYIRGFTNIFKIYYQPVNLKDLRDRFPADAEVTPEALAEAGLIRSAKRPVVLLGDGDVDRPLKVRVHRVSRSARAKIEAAGGVVELLPVPKLRIKRGQKH
ncbi:MAG: 50S ribosomal protein L15 [Chloroflexi bacterium]|nr:50S ribosomal protein L15 [Chloroflexota bacterium]